MRDSRDAGRRERWVTPVVVGLIAAATLTPSFGPGEPLSARCLICGSRGVADAIVNVMLFLPVGMALGWSLVRALPAVAVAVLLSGAIEAVQFLIPGRYPALGDILFNSLGAVLGVAAIRSLPTLLHPRPRARRRLAALAALLPAAVMPVTAWLLQPSFPTSVYYGQWTADLGHLAAYEGRILEATIGGFPAPSERLPDSDAVRARLLAGQSVRVVLRPGPRPPDLAPIFSVYDERQREIVLYGLDDRDLVLRYRSRAVAARLDQPDLRVKNGAFDLSLPSGSADDAAHTAWPDHDAATVPVTVELAVRLRREGFCLSLDGRERACPVAHTAGRGWALLLYPEALARRFGGGLDFVWVLVLTLPIGYWGRRVRPTLVLAVPAVAASLLMPWMFGQVRVSLWVTAAALLGPLLGLLVALSRRDDRTAPVRTRSRSEARRPGSP